ncbi:MAG: RluA family pseudouridine synthase [Pseudomonadota bacterium]
MRNRPIPKLSEAQKTQVRDLVLYEDAYIIAFNKPSGLAVQTRGNRGTSLDFLLWAFARSNGKRPHLLHRIDAGTSGLVLAAKTKPATAFLSAQFAERQVKKTYLALVSGALPDTSHGTCDAALLKTDRSVIVSTAEQGADAALTHWRVLSRREGHALIEARPHTGRMHQIRAHLAHLGCPILGDPIYGEGVRSANRLMLHASELELTLPDHEKRALVAPVPEAFEKKQTALGL